MDMETGDFLDESGNPTKDIEKAKVRIRKDATHKYLVTPHMDRWVPKGRFKSTNKIFKRERKVRLH